MALKNWMGYLPDDIRLKDCVFPATHDSGMSFSKLRSGVLHPMVLLAKPITGLAAMVDDLKNPRHLKASHNNFTTQIFGVCGQLYNGARQFDLRITRHNGTYRAYHGGYLGKLLAGQRKYGEKWADICRSIADFMDKNPTEFLILKLDKQSHFTTSMMKMLIKNLKLLYNNYPNGPRPPLKKWVCQEKIGNLRGRILICGKRGALKDWKKLQLHRSMFLCQWEKDKNGLNPQRENLNAKPGRGNFPVYLLLGSSEGSMTGMISKKASPLNKQITMKQKFIDAGPRTVGMRGIWFNTFSWVRDIRVYSNEIWQRSEQQQQRRNELWLDGVQRQNVASVDFLDEQKARYIILKNRHGDMANQNLTLEW